MESIFYYDPGTEWITYNNASFIPVFTDDVDSWVWPSTALRDTAYSLCGDDMSCLFDVYVTGDISVGAASKATAEDDAATSSALSKSLLLMTVEAGFTKNETRFYHSKVRN